MIVGFHFAQNRDLFQTGNILIAFRIGKIPVSVTPFEYRRIIFVGRQDSFASNFEGVLDHFEERLFLCLAVDIPIGIKNLMTTML